MIILTTGEQAQTKQATSKNQKSMNQKKRNQEDIKKAWSKRRARIQRTAQSERDLFIEFLFLMFLGLKLHGSIDWSWWFIFSPMIFHYFKTLYRLEQEARLVRKMTEEELIERGKEMVEESQKKK